MANTQNQQAGAVGRQDLPTFYPEQVLTLRDPGHLLYGKVNAERYDEAAPKNQELVESIREVGVLQPGMVWHDRGTNLKHVIFGTRRTLALAQVNAQRLELGQDPLLMPYRLVTKRQFTPADIATAIDLWATENNQREGNDWLTVAQGAALQLQLGVPPQNVLKRWPQITSVAMLRKLTDPAGILSAAEPLQRALAAGEIPLPKAMRIALLPVSEQVAAMEGKSGSAGAPKPKRKYMSPADREDMKTITTNLCDDFAKALLRDDIRDDTAFCGEVESRIAKLRELAQHL